MSVAAAWRMRGARTVLALALASAGAPAAGAPTGAGPEPGDYRPVVITLGQWQVRGAQLHLVVPLAEALTPKQRAMIDGGFTTLSQLILRPPRPGTGDEEEDPEQTVYSGRCSVKFDAWEETYDVARVDETPPETATVKAFAAYGERCLKADVQEPSVVTRLAEQGGTLFATLVVKQTSAEEAAHIKEWLIKQQSGVMQSLFSHMLGELTLNQTLKVRVSVPPRPSGAVLMPSRPAGKTPGPKPEGEKG